ncbi:MAG: hypothetical protein ACLQVD_14335 [Capsulimonadaceae bacterium]
MMVSVHAAVGAAVGALAGRRRAALAGGIVSHAICDLLPHRDFDIKIEAPLAAIVFAYLARRYGVGSPQFIGAAGAVLPDAENALFCLGIIPRETMLFPTHNDKRPWFIGHGTPIQSPLTQAILAAVCLAVADAKSTDR